MFELFFGYRSLMFVGTDTGGNTTEVVGNGGSARESIRFGFHDHRRPRNRKVAVSVGFNYAQTFFANIKY
jgi:hypothetical protein